MTPAGLVMGFRDYWGNVPAAVTEHHCLGLTHRDLTIWEAEVQDPNRFSVRWGSCSRFIGGILLLWSHMIGRNKVALWGLFYQDTNCMMRAPPPYHFLKPHLLIGSLWGLNVNIWILGGHQHSEVSFAICVSSICILVAHGRLLQYPVQGRAYVYHGCSRPLTLGPKATLGTSSHSPFSSTSHVYHRPLPLNCGSFV